MVVIDLSNNTNMAGLPPAVFALGNFDGVHAGHRDVLLKTAAAADKLGVRSAVWCLDGGNKGDPELLTTRAEKLKIFESLGLDIVFFENFEAIRNMTPHEFGTTYLEKLNCAGVLCGFNFRFGKGACADGDALRALCEERGIYAECVPAVKAGGFTVSSTVIRGLIKDGRTEEAEKLLCAPYSVSAVVSHGRHIGKKFGFPTINQKFESGKAVPRWGVYFTLTEIDGTLYPSISNVGARPTVNGHECRLETHILDFDGDVYGKLATVYFKKFLRAEVRFSSEDELCRMVEENILSARVYFSANGY